MASGDGIGDLDVAEVRAALEELLAWEPMRRSPQLGAFLRYIVEARINGDESNLKAYSIAVDVLGRGEDFDPQSDPIVRVQARRLRALISGFYASGQSRSRVRIDLPVGRYVPEFHLQEKDQQRDAATVPAQSGTARAKPNNTWLIGLIALVILVAAVAFWPSLSERTAITDGPDQPRMPVVIVEEFENLVADELGTPLVAGLAVELVTDFNRFPDISARYGGAQAALSPAEMALEMPIYRLTGVARRIADGVQYNALLTEGLSDSALATVNLVVPLVEGQPSMSIGDVAEHIVLRLASPRGVLHRPAREWLAATPNAPLDLYPCLVAYRLYVEHRTEAAADRARTCGRNLAADHWEAVAIVASMIAEDAWRVGVDTQEGVALLDEAEALAVSARDAQPTDSFLWSATGHVALVRGDMQSARDRYNSALHLNPAAVDTIATYAHVLAKVGNWNGAMRRTEQVLAAEAEPPAWFFLTPALYALRNGEYRQAIEHAQRTLGVFPDTSAAIMLAAGGSVRDLQIISTYLPRVLAGQRFRRMGILPALRQQIADPELMRQFSNGMSAAGVPIDRLARPF